MFRDSLAYPVAGDRGGRRPAVAAFLVPLAEPPSPLVSAVATVVALVAPVVALLGFHAAPAALSSLAVAGRPGAAFPVREVWSVVRSGSYALAWLLALGVGLVVAVVAGSIAALAGGVAASGIAPVVATLAIAIASSYATLVTSFLYARGFAAARPVDPRPTPTGTSGRPWRERLAPADAGSVPVDTGSTTGTLSRPTAG